jgi:hypothetical protein
MIIDALTPHHDRRGPSPLCGVATVTPLERDAPNCEDRRILQVLGALDFPVWHQSI